MESKLINEVSLETVVEARFVHTSSSTEEGRKSIAALNLHAEGVSEILQPIFQKLIIEMLSLKQEYLTKEGPQ